MSVVTPHTMRLWREVFLKPGTVSRRENTYQSEELPHPLGPLEALRSPIKGSTICKAVDSRF